ncbi:hypothetical protein MKZ38_001951 [Zalerion maritima]|uniref:Uncharacterized protein n=1 Tax=Zalerion maritima TaxID=339359 RepID=A0AAD5RR25_9PEZI|nr:hypothetical protein MKZ38_001951 [Zalerion maritima]
MMSMSLGLVGWKKECFHRHQSIGLAIGSSAQRTETASGFFPGTLIGNACGIDPHLELERSLLAWLDIRITIELEYDDSTDNETGSKTAGCRRQVQIFGIWFIQEEQINHLQDIPVLVLGGDKRASTPIVGPTSQVLNVPTTFPFITYLLGFGFLNSGCRGTIMSSGEDRGQPVSRQALDFFPIISLGGQGSSASASGLAHPVQGDLHKDAECNALHSKVQQGESWNSGGRVHAAAPALQWQLSPQQTSSVH